MKIAFRSLVVLFGLLLVSSSCSILDQANEIKAFTRCSFRLVDIQDAVLAGVDIQDVESFSDLSFSETSKISMAALSGELPLDLTVNLEVENPNPEKASVSALYWVLYIDDMEITEGRISDKVIVPPDGGRAIMPVPVQVDLWEVITGETSDAIMNFAMNLGGSGEYPTRLKLKIKPSVYVAMKKLNYPGFFTIEEAFVSE
jgi:hypothetical protein